MSGSNLIYPRLRSGLKIVASDELGMTTSCISCINFDEKGNRNNFNAGPETCLKHRARPPARVIAFGCKDYFDNDEVPF